MSTHLLYMKHLWITPQLIYYYTGWRKKKSRTFTCIIHLSSRNKSEQNICNYVKKCSVYIQCKGDIMVVDIKQHKLQLKNSNITITQCQKNFADCVMVKFEFLN